MATRLQHHWQSAVIPRISPWALSDVRLVCSMSIGVCQILATLAVLEEPATSSARLRHADLARQLLHNPRACNALKKSVCTCLDAIV